MVRQRHFTRHWHLAADQADIGEGMMGGAKRVRVTQAVRSPVRPVTQWMRVVSRASGRVTAGRIVVSRPANILVKT